MRDYLVRRILLIVPTLFGISLAVFVLIQLVPGGPVEQYLAQLEAESAQLGAKGEHQVTEREVELIRKHFGFDKPKHVQFLNWLKDLLRFDLGESFFYQRPVWDVIASKFPISLFFGITSFILSYAVCITLGAAKAIRHGGVFDTVSSLLVFIGYVIPSYALGVLLIVLFSGGYFLDLFPITGIVSDDHEELTNFGKVVDFLNHMVLPMTCYMAGQFAVITLLMKNSLMEELQKDYMRTALLKGSSFRVAVWRHAFRNSLIPIATGIGEIFTLMFAGSLLIERVFDIDGMGLLFFNSMLNRDYPVVMGLIFLISLMTLLGRLFSDICYAVIDPRIRFK